MEQESDSSYDSMSDNQLQVEESYQNIQSQHSQGQSSSINQQDQMQKMKKAEANIQDKLKHLPYEVLIKHRQQLNRQKEQLKQKIHKKSKIKSFSKKKVKREKNQPIEKCIHSRPSHRKVGLFQSEKRKTIDPRFEDYAGTYDRKKLLKSYKFIQKVQENQIEEIQKKLKKKNTSQKEKRIYHQNLMTIKKQIRQRNQQDLKQAAKSKLTKFGHQGGENFYPKKKFLTEQVNARKNERMTQTERRTKKERKQKQEEKKKMIMKPKIKRDRPKIGKIGI